MKQEPRCVGLIAPFPPQIGGVPSVAAWLLSHQDEIGCSYVTFDLRRPSAGDAGGRLTATTLVLQARNLVRLLAWLRRAPRLVHYCVAMNPTGLARDLFFLSLVRATGRDAISHLHGGSQLCHARTSSVYRMALRWLRRVSGEIVAGAPRLAEQLREHGVSARVISNPVRVEPSVTGSRDRQNAATSALFVGRWGHDKGLPELLTAVAAARADGTDVRLRVVGSARFASDEEPIRKRISALRLHDVVTFVGVLDAGELGAEYASADMLCLPSRAEGVPMVVLEAMAYALPVVATRIGGTPDVVADGVTGVLVDVGSVAALQRAIETLASDRDTRERMGRAGRERVLGLADPSRIADEWRRMYSSM
jgi:glycosyltransferase involved in cell wall biosynthesis